MWRAGAAAGHRVDILDDGELAIGAAPDLPGPPFNLGHGFVEMPHLLGRARDHFAANGVIGWAWTDAAPWPGAEPDASAVYAAAAVEAVPAGDPPAGVVVRRLRRKEVGAWGAIVAAAGGMDDATARAFADLEAHLASEAHHHRFVAELDGRAVGTGSLHTHHHVGWLRAGVVLPEARGRGIQRALIRERAAHARELGCDVIGASANADGISARNLERAGARVVAERGRYRIDSTAPIG
jgi:GNAT superfamily N-acetyltransferase